jgi:ATP-dependent DNA helicase Rep
MVEEIGYEAWLHANSANAQAAERRMENIRFLLDNLQSAYQYEQEESDDATIKDAINRLILRDMMERQSEEEEEDTVQMLTMHAAKGLEYPTVFMIGVEEEILPHRNSIESDDIEEERRLAYVGITRARENLIITYANQRKQFGEMLDTTPSRFIDELPSEHIQFEGRSSEDSEANIQQGQETLDGLKRLFDDF